MTYLDTFDGNLARLRAMPRKTAQTVTLRHWVEFLARPRQQSPNDPQWIALAHPTGSAVLLDHFEIVPNTVLPPLGGGTLAGGDEVLLPIRLDLKFMYSDVLDQNLQIRALLAERKRKARLGTGLNSGEVAGFERRGGLV